MPNSIIRLQVDEDLKKKAVALYKKFDMDISDAVEMFLKVSVDMEGIPFSVEFSQQVDKTEEAIAAVQRLHLAAKENGTAEMTLEEINAEITAARIERRKKKT